MVGATRRTTDVNFSNLDAYRLDRILPAGGRLTVGVSGGRSSGYQAAHIIEANGGAPPGVVFNFENTGKEREETLAFVDRLDRHFQMGLVWLERDGTAPHKYRKVTYETASRNGEPFDELYTEIVPKRRDGTAGVRPLPNPAQRTCTAELKTKTMHRYLRNELHWPTHYYSALGFRADEPGRVKRNRAASAKRALEGGWGVFPMFDAGVKESDVRRFWSAAPALDLKLDSNYGNCDFCFMKSTWKIKETMLLDALEQQVKPRPGVAPPPTVQWWVDMEARESDRSGPFRRDRPGYQTLWEQVCAGDMESAVAENKADVCGSCGD